MSRRDEDALSWDGDDDPTLDARASAATEAADDDGAPDDRASTSSPDALPEGWTALGRGSGSISHTGRPPSTPADALPGPPEPSSGADGEAGRERDSALNSGTDDVAESSAAPGTARAPVSPAAAQAHDDEAPAALGTAALVSIGVLGGVYLLYAVGWLIGGLRLQGRYQVLVTDSMYQGALWLATAAPLIWFTTTIFATRASRGWVRWVWLIAGVVLLVPWPFLMMGAVGR